MSYLTKLGDNTAIMDCTPVEIPYDLFRLFVSKDELDIVAESMGYERAGELGKDDSIRFYSGNRDGNPAVAIEHRNYEYHVFLVDDMERPLTEKNLFYWCGLYLTECYVVSKDKVDYHVVRYVWEEDEYNDGKAEATTFNEAVKLAMIQQMNLKPVAKNKENKNVR